LAQDVPRRLGPSDSHEYEASGKPLAVVYHGELTACDERGIPDFLALHFNSPDDVRCVWAFDILYLNGKDLPLLLTDRKERLERLKLGDLVFNALVVGRDAHV
jgi:ATP-dependent DNA ligase